MDALHFTFSYHQKVPYDAPDLEIKDKTFGLVKPEEFDLPAISGLWTPVAYASFDISLNADEDKKKKVRFSTFDLNNFYPAQHFFSFSFRSLPRKMKAI